MNVLLVGRGSGSWTMRGLQLGAAIGARVTSSPTEADWIWADRVVLVKRDALLWAARAHASQLPVIWDAVDFWRQPGDNALTADRAMARLGAALEVIQPHLFVGATQAMADAGGGAYLPHHSWAGLVPTPARERVHVVAYQGNAAYLAIWLGDVARACAARRWRFVVNPPDLREADLIVALREGPWDGWICREWKSGVKLVNAIAAGRPVITQASAPFRELRPPGTVIHDVQDLDDAFDAWTPLEARAAAVESCRALAPALTLAAIAAQYRALLADVAVAA